MIVKSYDARKQMYTVKVTKDELEKAFISRESYRDFIFKTFGFRLTLEDFEKSAEHEDGR